MADSTKTVITSFTQAGYEEYGKNFLDTFAENWPDDVQLVVYTEGVKTPPVVYHHVVTWEPISLVEGHDQFMQKIDGFTLFKGDTGHGYSINYDARMCRKSLMECHAMKTIGGKIFWVDADVITHSKIPDGFLDEVLPDDKFCCYLGRDAHPIGYTESGFLGFNAAHPLTAAFRSAYFDFIMSGGNFTNKGWHDCYAFDTIRKACPQELFNNLGEGIALTKTAHVFVNSVLGKYMDHLKGNRKKTGRSSEGDLTVEREEEYWRSRETVM